MPGHYASTLRLLDLALDGQSFHALMELSDFCERAVQATAAGTYDGASYLAVLRDPRFGTAYKAAAGIVHGACRDATEATNGYLTAGAIQARILSCLYAQHRAITEHHPAAGTVHVTSDSDGQFILHTWATLGRRGCRPHELHHWQLQLARGAITRDGLEELARAARAVDDQREAANAALPPGDLALHIMGTGDRVTQSQWRAIANAAAAAGRVPSPDGARFHLRPGPPAVRISAVASLYKGGPHIERFLANITAQTCFADYAELIIIDAASPDGERAVIERYLPHYPNIRYVRADTRIGIYEAWNRAIGMARGEYITNTNVDDLRRADSFELQAATLDNLPFVDVVYQDFLYTFDPDVPWDRIAAAGCQSRLPIITTHTLLHTNPPHNAPMWRRRLHDEVGFFDTRYESAADYDFWLRCLAAGKHFYKLNDTHVVYYQNPQGVSTRADTRGHVETRDILRRHAHKLLPAELVMDFDDFCRTYLPGHPVLAVHREEQDRPAVVRQALRSLAWTDGYSPLSIDTDIPDIYTPAAVPQAYLLLAQTEHLAEGSSASAEPRAHAPQEAPGNGALSHRAGEGRGEGSNPKSIGSSEGLDNHAHPPPNGPVAQTRSIRLLVDCAIFQPDPVASTALDHNHLAAARQYWERLLCQLAQDARLQLLLLDRGGTPAIPGAQALPFPDLRLTEAAADAKLLQDVCNTVLAQAFVSTSYTVPLHVQPIPADTATSATRQQQHAQYRNQGIPDKATVLADSIARAAFDATTNHQRQDVLSAVIERARLQLLLAAVGA